MNACELLRTVEGVVTVLLHGRVVTSGQFRCCDGRGDVLAEEEKALPALTIISLTLM